MELDLSHTMKAITFVARIAGLGISDNLKRLLNVQIAETQHVNILEYTKASVDQGIAKKTEI